MKKKIVLTSSRSPARTRPRFLTESPLFHQPRILAPQARQLFSLFGLQTIRERSFIDLACLT
jgi:hypothetical protein